MGLVGFSMIRTGKISKWRSVMFIAIAWLFLFNKVFRGLIDVPIMVSYGEAFSGGEAQEVPDCHIAIGSSILNYGYQQYLAVKSGQWSDWGPLSLGFLWIVVPLIFGRSWCSWGCFYGGLDEGFSRILRRPLLRWFKLPGKIRDLPAAILLFMVLISLTTMVPAFCLWVCPLKLTTEFLDPNDSVRKIQLAIFASLGVGAIVLIPVLTKKRLFCGLICPFGAWQALVGRINPFKVSIDSDKCTMCQKCMRACPTFAISKEDMDARSIGPYCNNCGECIGDCPHEAIRYTVFSRDVRPSRKGTFFSELLDPRDFFFFAYLLLGGAIGSLCLY